VTDRQTDRRTDRITIPKTVQRIASHGKNLSRPTGNNNRTATYKSITAESISSVIRVWASSNDNDKYITNKHTYIHTNIRIYIIQTQPSEIRPNNTHIHMRSYSIAYTLDAYRLALNRWLCSKFWLTSLFAWLNTETVSVYLLWLKERSQVK